MSLLALIGIHALFFRPHVYNHPEELDSLPVIPRRAKAAGALSLVLWTGMVCAGRMIGYYEPPQQKGQTLPASAYSTIQMIPPGRSIVTVK
jgi:hypothetical protein